MSVAGERTTRSARNRWLALAVVVVLVVSGGVGWRATHRASEVYDGSVRPISVRYAAPSYAVVRNRAIAIGHGTQQVAPKKAVGALWLPDGQVLVDLKHGTLQHHYQLLGADGRTHGPVLSADDDPSRPGERLNLWVSKADPDGDRPHDKLRSYDSRTLRLVETLTMPGPASKGPDPKNNPFDRYYKQYAATIDENTFAIYADGNDEDDGGEDGVVMFHDGKAKDVLVNQRITSLRLSSDGASLLAVQQKHGRPCGGCVVNQEIVEINPEDGTIAGRYQVPAAYQKGWRVDRIDKIDGRVAVGYVVGCVDPGCGNRVVGTYVYDGSWTKVKGSEKANT